MDAVILNDVSRIDIGFKHDNINPAMTAYLKLAI